MTSTFSFKMPAHMLARTAWHTARDMFSRPRHLIETDPDFAAPFTPEEIVTAAAIKTLCMPLGPYRNLTTVSAAIYALHPQAFVLNHGGIRLWRDPEMDFFTDGSAERWRNFSLAATRMAQRGGRGDHGGSILHAHAFDNSAMRRAYEERFGDTVLPDAPRALFWKESMRIANRLRAMDFDYSRVRSMPVAIRFILPVRSPLDCALSSMTTGHYVHLSRSPLFTKMDVLRKIVDFYAYANRHMEKHPDLFFILSEQDLNREMLCRLAAFSGLDDDRQWTDTVIEMVKFEKHYEHTAQEWASYKKLVAGRLGSESPLAQALLAFG